MNWGLSAIGVIRRAWLAAAVLAAVAAMTACGGDGPTGSGGAQPGSAPPSAPEPLIPETPADPPAMTTAVVAGGPGVEGLADTVAGTFRTATLTFRMPAGARATSLSVAGLQALPPGWSTLTPAFSCAEVRSDDACTLTLQFAPAEAVAPQTLSLDYRYTDASGAVRHATASLSYSARAANAVVAAVSPAGTLQARIGQTSRISVDFATNDGSTATDLTVTSLAALPAGWSSSSSSAQSFQCATVATGGCTLTLDYLPTAAATGSLSLNYAYTDNSGEAQTGTVSLPYAATAPGSIGVSASPSILANTRVGESASTTITFTATAGTTITALNVPLNALPAGWSAASAHPFTCPTVASGTPCKLTLTWTPPSNVSFRTLPLPFTYTDDVGAARTGTLSLAYSGLASHLVAAGGDGTMGVTELGANGLMKPLTKTSYSWPVQPESMAIQGDNIYVGTTGDVRYCMLSDEQPIGCWNYAVAAPMYALAISPDVRALGASNVGGQEAQLCGLSVTGHPSGCHLEPALPGSYSIGFHRSRVYVGQLGGVLHCAIHTGTTTVSDCQTVSLGIPDSVMGLAFQGQFAWAAAGNGVIYRCSADSAGRLSACSAAYTGLPADSLAAKDWRLYVGRSNRAGLTQFDIDRDTGALTNRRDMAADMGPYMMIGVD